jgi:hypothetical protein
MLKQVSELWKLDIHTYQWENVNTLKNWNSPPPPAREQHVGAVVQGDIYIFGGKTRLFPFSASGSPLLIYENDHVFNDIWKLTVEKIRRFLLTWFFGGGGFYWAPFDRRCSGEITGTQIINDGNIENARMGQCIAKMTVKVNLFSRVRPCLSDSVLGHRW